MGLFDFFRKITKKKIEESKAEEEKIAFSDIENWIEGKRNETKAKEKEIFVLVNEKINNFNGEIKEKIKAVEDIDIEPKKAEDRIKFAVNEGRKKYIGSLRDFTEKLEKLERENLGEFIDDVNKIFFDFNKNSHMSYERTTILIGKEMTNIKDSLKGFSRNLIKIFDEIYKSIINSINSILHYEYLYKRIKLFNNHHDNLQTFTTKCAKTYNLSNEQIKKIKEIIEVNKKHKESSMEFVKKDKIVILSDSLGTKTIDIYTIKEYLIIAKELVLNANKRLNN